MAVDIVCWIYIRTGRTQAGSRSAESAIQLGGNIRDININPHQKWRSRDPWNIFLEPVENPPVVGVTHLSAKFFVSRFRYFDRRQAEVNAC